MSLLLDALKKAAEEKKKTVASSDAGNSAATDNPIAPEESDFGFDLKDDDTEISRLDQLQQSESVNEEFQSIIIKDDDTGMREFETALEFQATDDEAEDVIHVDTDGDTHLPSFDEDESILFASDDDASESEKVSLSSEDVSDFLGRSDFSTPSAGIIDENTELTSTVSKEYEDLSLSLLDAEDTFEEVADDYSLAGEKTSTITEPAEATVTAGIELENLRNENTIIRRDITSTHTYAPDNYDRTLIRPVNEDASRIFAGMKPEEDVLITPDYAKKVFLSKSSAHRVQHYKVYVGITLGILLAIGILALTELEHEFDRVDAALLPLKRDPMPGVIRAAGVSNSASMSDESDRQQVDNKTLELIESAELTVHDSVEIQTDDIVSTREVESDDITRTVESQIAESNLAGSEVVVEEKPGRETSPVVVAKVNNKKKVKQVKQINEIKDQQIPAGTVKISISNKISDLDRRLAEAYSAYRRGDDKTALENYNKVLEVDPLNRNALLARAAIAIQDGDVASAIADYQLLLVQNPKDSLAMSSLISVTSISPQRSETQLKIMIREEPDSPYLNFVLANIYGAQNRWQEAQSYYFKALENNPEDPNYAYNLAISLEHISKPKVAIAYYEKALVNINKGLATFDEVVVSSRLEMLRKL